MGWAYCGKDEEGRDIGYGIEAACDHQGCGAKISRGLSNVCGGMHGGGEHGCGKYFCWNHLMAFGNVCKPCQDKLPDEYSLEDE